MYRLFPLILLLLTATVACRHRPPAEPRKYLFLGHPYSWSGSGDRMDARVERLPFDDYDQIWLGGDVCARTTERQSTLGHLDSLLGIRAGKVHWAWGNHDEKFGHPEYITRRTGRPSYYAAYRDGLCMLVLNTNLFQWPSAHPGDSICGALEEQYELVRRLADTIRESSHLVVLHHYGLLTSEQTAGRYAMDTVFNYYQPGLKVRCEPPTDTFANRIYPLLARVQKKGVQVVCVGGDMGMRAKKFAFRTGEGIWFLGAGINNGVPEWHRPDYLTNFDPDQLLIFRHWPERGKLEWEFVELGEIGNGE